MLCSGDPLDGGLLPAVRGSPRFSPSSGLSRRRVYGAVCFLPDGGVPVLEKDETRM